MIGLTVVPLLVHAILLYSVQPSKEIEIFHSSLPSQTKRQITHPSLELLLGSELVGVAAFLLSAVGGTGWETGLYVMSILVVLKS